MKKECVFILSVLVHTTTPITFTGVVEAGITKNNFLCPTDSSSSIPCTSNANTSCALHDDQILQIFNDQAFWLHQKAISAAYQQTTLNYSSDDLKEKLNTQGWGAMGGYCIIVTTNTLLGSFVQPNIQPKKNQKKVIAQLWYNGHDALELWSQDVQLLNQDQTFQIVISNQPDTLSTLSTTTPNKTLKNEFLTALNIQPNNRDQAVYTAAIDCPRSIKIQE